MERRGRRPRPRAPCRQQKGWQPNPLFGYGGVYEAEWDEVIRKGWRLPEDWEPDEIPEPEVPLTKWGDYSQYQTAHVDKSYPYQVISFRASVADERFPDPGSSTGYAGMDNKWLENMRRAKELVKQGKLKQDHRLSLLGARCRQLGRVQARPSRPSGGMFPELAAMLDIEDGGDKWHGAR